MKCTSIKLSARDQCKHPKNAPEEDLTHFIAEQNHRYSFPWIRRGGDHTPDLKITTLSLPESVKGFNTGSSIEKWSKKRPRLKSCKNFNTPDPEDDRDFCYENLESDLSLLLNDLDEGFDDNDSMSNLQYEIHTDIEELLRKSQREHEACEISEDKKRRRKKRLKKDKSEVRISRAASPSTEQIIRVNVVACDSCKNNEGKNDADEEDFVVKCRQLALERKKLQ